LWMAPKRGSSQFQSESISVSGSRCAIQNNDLWFMKVKMRTTLLYPKWVLNKLPVLI